MIFPSQRKADDKNRLSFLSVFLLLKFVCSLFQFKWYSVDETTLKVEYLGAIMSNWLTEVKRKGEPVVLTSADGRFSMTFSGSPPFRAVFSHDKHGQLHELMLKFRHKSCEFGFFLFFDEGQQ